MGAEMDPCGVNGTREGGVVIVEVEGKAQILISTKEGLETTARHHLRRKQWTNPSTTNLNSSIDLSFDIWRA